MVVSSTFLLEKIINDGLVSKLSLNLIFKSKEEEAEEGEKKSKRKRTPKGPIFT